MRPTDTDHREALRGHAGRVERYRHGELTDSEFRPIRLGYGLAPLRMIDLRPK